MSISGNKAQRSTTVTTMVPEPRKPVAEHGPASKKSVILGIVENEIESKLSSTYKDGNGYKATFVFQTRLREYVQLQGQAWGGKRNLSNIISFTSASSTVDAIALLTSEYVAETWKQKGVKLLQMIERALALKKTGNQEVKGRLTQRTHVSVTFDGHSMLLEIQGPKVDFAEIIEQACWLASVASEKSISLLKTHIEETNGGTRTRGYSEILHTGKPIMEAGRDDQFEVSFTTSQPKRGPFTESGNCWKTMVGLSIVAHGYAIRKRPKEGYGLEAPLPILRQLFKRGCRGKRVLPLDKPMVMIATKAGKQNEAIQLRLIMAIGSQQCSQGGKAIYWHFDPATLCNSMESCEQLEKKVRVGSSGIETQSRHFVGWSDKVGVLAGTSKTNDEVYSSSLHQLPHFGLVLPSLALNIRIPPIFSLTASAAREKRTYDRIKVEMSDAIKTDLIPLERAFFVLWDTKAGRGWMVKGPVAALHLVRGYLTAIPPDSSFDFSKLKHINEETPSAAYNVLIDPDNLGEAIYKKHKDVKKIPDNAQESKDEGEQEWTTLAGVVMAVLRALQTMQDEAETIDLPPAGHQSWFQEWYGKRWDYTVRGRDFNLLASGKKGGVFFHKFNKDPGWLRLTRALKTPFLFGSYFGDILKPHDGHCCPHFKTLPKGHNYLAVGMDTIQACLNHEGGGSEPKETVARLSLELAWERGINPFNHPHGQGDHLDKVDSSCFPVQDTVEVPDILKGKDMEILKKKKGRPYSWQEADDLNTAPKDRGKNPKDKSPKLGVVVFGKVPDEKKLKQLAQVNSQRNHQSDRPKTPTAAARSSSTPGSHEKTHSLTGPAGIKPTAAAAGTTPVSQSGPGSSGLRPAEPSTSIQIVPRSMTPAQQTQAGAAQRQPSSSSLRSTISSSDARGATNPTNGPGQSSVAPARRVPSVSSIKSTKSGTQVKGPSAGPDAERPHASNRETLTTSAHRAASNASLRSTDSNTRAQTTIAGSGRRGESAAGPSAPTAARTSSISSVRTTSSAASKDAGAPQPQVTAGQPPIPVLKKSDTYASDKTTSSRSSRKTQSSTAESIAADQQQRQRQRQHGQLSAVAAAAGTTDQRPTSSGPTHTTHSGPDGQS